MRILAGLAVVCAACGASSSPPPAQAQLPDPCASDGRWRPVAPITMVGRVDHTAVWTGNEMVVWGGTQGTNNPRADGARYRPDDDRWAAVTGSDAPMERDDHAAVWTGREMIVWGGNSYDEDTEKLDDGGRYDPERDSWQPIAAAGLSARDDPRAVWTGREMIVWGGRDVDGHTADGARYDPAKDRWRRVSDAGAPAPREDHTAVWTGTEMIVWGGWNGDDDARDYALGGARYDPAHDRWQPISDVGAPEPREDHTAIWTGREMIVWGGVRRDAADGERHQLASGGRYDPATDTWTAITMDEAPAPREDDVVVWTGSQMVVWGGQQDDVPMETGARYVPASDVWCAMSDDGAPSARRDTAGVWTGTALVLWGGRDADGEYPETGATYIP